MAILAIESALDVAIMFNDTDMIVIYKQALAEAGVEFRIYEQEDFEYIFGIDGCGYDFYEAHWIPLYEKRGFHWDDETVKEMKENA